MGKGRIGVPYALIMDTLRGSGRLLVVRTFHAFHEPPTSYYVWGFGEGDTVAFSEGSDAVQFKRISEPHQRRMEMLWKELRVSGIDGMEEYNNAIYDPLIVEVWGAYPDRYVYGVLDGTTSKRGAAWMSKMFDLLRGVGLPRYAVEAGAMEEK